MRKYQMDPRQITAKFDCFCAETGKRIKKGERCIYYPTAKKVYSLDSNQAEEFRNWSFDVSVLGYDY